MKTYKVLFKILVSLIHFCIWDFEHTFLWGNDLNKRFLKPDLTRQHQCWRQKRCTIFKFLVILVIFLPGKNNVKGRKCQNSPIKNKRICSNLKKTKVFNASSLIISVPPSKMQSLLSACIHTCISSRVLQVSKVHQGFTSDLKGSSLWKMQRT